MARLVIALVLSTLSTLSHTASASAETVDLVSFVPPAGCSLERKPQSVVMTRLEEGGYCVIAVHVSTPASGNLEAPFRGEWGAVVNPR